MNNELIRLSSWQGFDHCFRLEGQPVVSFTDSSWVCDEMLLRCHFAPSIADLIVAYERAELTAIVDKWVAQQALTYLSKNPMAECSINISPVTLRDITFASTLTKMAELSGVNPSRLKIELTERYLLVWSAEADSALIKLRQQGFKLWLDDFGMGHSLHDMTERVCPQAIKMDGSFVRRLGEPKYLRAVQHIVAIAQEFGCLTIAEGIESEETLERVKEIGFDMGQGHHLASPGPLNGSRPIPSAIA